MSWSGPRKVKEPAPPNRKPKLTKVGKKVKENVQSKQNALREKALQEPKKALETYPEKLDKKTLRGCALMETYSAFRWAVKYIDKETIKELALKEPKYAFLYGAKHLDKKIVRDIALQKPWHALVYGAKYLDKETLLECALKEPDYALLSESKYLDEDILKVVAEKKYPFIYGNKANEYTEGGTSWDTRKALFEGWVYNWSAFIGKQFRDNVADIYNIKNVNKATKHFMPFPKRTKKVIRKLYKETQEKLQQEYPSGKVALYRGIKNKVDIPYGVNSFTVREGVADRFDGYDVIKKEVRIEDILSYPGSGSITGYSKEGEFIVMGNYKDF